MAKKQQMIRRLELLVFCMLAAVGSLYCQNHHRCVCGHLAHGQHTQVTPWITDSIWALGVAGAAGVGIRGGFHGARMTGIVAIALIIAMVSSFPKATPAGIIVTITLGPLSVYHLICMIF